MDEIPVPEIDMGPLLDLIMGAERFQVLAIAIRHEIFNLCKYPKTLDEICGTLKTDPKITKKMLNALVAINLLSKKGDEYVNEPIANVFLIKDSPFYQGDYIRLEESGYNLWPKLDQMLREGIRTIGMTKMKAKTENLEKVVDPTFTLTMANFAMRGGVQQVVKVLSDLPEFKKAKRMLDLGCGTGIYSIGLALSNPNLEVTGFDIPPVLEITREFISRYGVGDRFKMRGGNYMQDDFGSGYDIVLASHTFYGYSKEMLLSLLRRIYKALNDGGILVSNHYGLNEDGTGHKITVFWDLWLTLYSYQTTTYTNDEYADLLKKAGFTIIQTIDISMPSYPSTLIIGKKEAK
jgi:predicted O-methyltransferase YrrM